MENISKVYLDKLENANNPGKVLTAFYQVLFDRSFSVSTIRMFHKLVRVYGRYDIYFALLNIHDSYQGRGDLDHNNLYGLIAYFAKKALKEECYDLKARDDNISNYVDNYTDFVSKKRGLEIPDTFKNQEEEEVSE